MKKFISFLLCLTLFAMCLNGFAEETVALQPEPDWNQKISFTGMDDENLLDYMEDSVYSQLVADLNSDEYFVENVQAIYVSKEYLDELAYNSQTNIFYGYSLAELDEYFEGTRYVFTVQDGQTVAVPMQVIEDKTFDQILTNVAIGTGVILLCVVVSAATSGAGAPAAIHMIFAVGAKTAAVCAASGTVISGVSSAAVRYYQTGDLNEALRAGAVGASEGYKWGAITGALTGMASETWGLYKATRLGKEIKDGLTWNQAALIQKESGYPLDVIKQFHSMKEYEVFKSAGLQPHMINGKLALTRTDINLSQIDPVSGKTNLELMKLGRAPLDALGKPYELHHIGQNVKGTLAILTSAEHDAAALHGYKAASEINRAAFDKIRKEFWKTMADMLSGGM